MTVTDYAPSTPLHCNPDVAAYKGAFIEDVCKIK